MPISIFMEFEIDSPTVLLPAISGVYKLIFSNGYFYFGSTQDLRDKISHYISDIKSNRKLTKNIWVAIRSSESMKIEIIAICYSKQESLQIEDRYIKLFLGNPLLLNRSPSAYSSKGLVQTEEEKQKMRDVMTAEIRERASQLMKGNNYSAYLKKKVAKFDLDGNLIEIYPSITQAAKEIPCQIKGLRDHLKGFGNTLKGCLFRYVNKNGTVKARPETYPDPRKKGRKRVGLINGSSKKAFENKMNSLIERHGNNISNGQECPI